ncbi:hypothetical protein [Frankia sp. Cas3]|uniref:hypothetical protein n=1 Tax=Frankia sp. Cas3 TaxID=3073926 RepID=UPI002AD3009B|nr:hypothetical protein [Frankia sp. Cas3]
MRTRTHQRWSAPATALARNPGAIPAVPHNRAELERRLGHANDRYLRLYTNPPDDIAAGWVENL